MDYTFNEYQEMLKRQFRDFMEKEWSIAQLRELQQNKQDYVPEIYKKMAGLGWLGLMIPPEYGGIESDWVDMAIFYEELGRALLPTPHYSSVVLGGQTILAFGTDAQKQEFLPKISKGELIVSLALAEADADARPASFSTKSAPDGDGYMINGAKLFISSAHLADQIVTVTQGEGGQIAILAVDKNTPGLTCVPLDTLSGERLSEIKYENVKVPQNSLLGKLNGSTALAELLDKVEIMPCAEMVGGSQAVLEMTLDYTKQRISNDHPIGFFQVIQHKIVDIYMSIEAMRWLLYKAAWLASEGKPFANEAAMLRLYASRTYSWITQHSAHIHGTVSLIIEHDLPFYFRKAKGMQLNLGSADSHDDIICQSIGI